MAAANPSAVIQATDSIWLPTFWTAMAVSPKSVTMRVRTMEIPLYIMVWTPAGNPIFMIWRIYLRLVRSRIWTWLNTRVSLRANHKNTAVTTAWAPTVAMAAPAAPMAGMGPNPKIRKGSRTMLITSPITLATKGVRLSPDAVRIPVKMAFKKEKRISPQVMVR